METTAALAHSMHMTRLSAAELKYKRAMLAVLVKARDANKDELSAYFALLNELTGSEFSAEDQLTDRVTSGKARYEYLTGHQFDSPEFDAAVEETIRAMQG